MRESEASGSRVLRAIIFTVQRCLLLAACVTITMSGSVPSAQSQELPLSFGSMTPLEEVTDIRSQPLALLAKFPEAGVKMARYVAELVSSQPSVMDAIMSIINDATPEQASAIGAGVARSVRATEAKESPVSFQIAQKADKTQNPWFKTTFRAIEPGFTENSPLILPDTIPPAPLATAYVGQELPTYKSRLGPAGINPLFAGKPIVISNESSFLVRRGTIVAIMASDNKKNGAVSTSPTI